MGESTWWWWWWSWVVEGDARVVLALESKQLWSDRRRLRVLTLLIHRFWHREHKSHVGYSCVDSCCLSGNDTTICFLSHALSSQNGGFVAILRFGFGYGCVSPSLVTPSPPQHELSTTDAVEEAQRTIRLSTKNWEALGRSGSAGARYRLLHFPLLLLCLLGSATLVLVLPVSTILCNHFVQTQLPYISPSISL